MLVSHVLAEKGDLVVTIHPDTSLEHATRQLSQFGFGALVASDDGSTIAGIISERDIVRRIAEHGPAALAVPVRSVMVRAVVTCTAGDTLDHLMKLMTDGRFRHVPVVDGATLCGMISIGDVVKRRVVELETETRELQNYLVAGA